MPKSFLELDLIVSFSYMQIERYLGGVWIPAGFLGAPIFLLKPRSPLRIFSLRRLPITARPSPQVCILEQHGHFFLVGAVGLGFEEGVLLHEVVVDGIELVDGSSKRIEILGRGIEGRRQMVPGEDCLLLLLAHIINLYQFDHINSTFIINSRPTPPPKINIKWSLELYTSVRHRFCCCGFIKFA